MPHGVFVETVNANSDIDLTVQTLNAFLRANPPPVRNQQMAAAVAAAINNETDKRKGGVSKALGKLTSRWKDFYFFYLNTNLVKFFLN